MIKALFFDRDGVLIEDKGYVYKTKDLQWKTGAIRAIKYLNSKKILVIIITNQSGIGRGFYQKKDVKLFHNYMSDELKKDDAWIDGFYFSPYYKNSKNFNSYYYYQLRKPNVGMLKKAQLKFSLKKKEILMIGDKKTDHQAANKFGIKFSYKSKSSLFTQLKKLTKFIG